MHSPALERPGGALAPLAAFASDPGIALPVAIGSDEAVAHRGWRNARDRVLAAVEIAPSLTVIVGAAGTGKSLLLQDVARTLRAEGTAVWLQGSGELDVDPPGPSSVALIDEAERMSAAVVARLGQLGDCAVVLARSTDPACGAVVRLEPLPAVEVGAFVATRLARAGLPPDLPTASAVSRLAERSHGVPRALNTLLAAALVLARQAGSERIEAAHVDDAAGVRELADFPPPFFPPPTEPHRPDVAASHDRGILPVVCSVFVVAAAAGWLLLAHGQRPAERIAVATRPLPVEAAPQARQPPVAGLVPKGADDRPAAAPVVAASKPTEPPPPVVAAEPKVADTTPRAAPPIAATKPANPPTPVAASEPRPASTAPPSAAALFAALPPAPPPPVVLPPPVAAHAPKLAPAVPPTHAPTAAPAAVTSPPPAPMILPADTPAHVVLMLAAGDVAAIGAKLRAAGFAVEAQPTDAPLGGSAQVRYFFAEDRGAALAVSHAADLTEPVQAAANDVWHRPGLIQIVAAPQSTRDSAPASPRVDVKLQRR